MKNKDQLIKSLVDYRMSTISELEIKAILKQQLTNQYQYLTVEQLENELKFKI